MKTTPRGEIRRTLLFPASATTIAPLEGTTATLLGDEKLAAAPAPSAKAALPLPARVETTPWTDKIRILLFPVSAMTMAPLDVTTATPCGAEKAAEEAAPSA